MPSNPNDMHCPRCGSELTTAEAITILNGSGFTRIAVVKLPDGTIDYREAGLVDPTVLEVLG